MSDNSLQNLVDVETVLQAIGTEVIRMVMVRTRKGVDVEGLPFKAYSEQYAKRRTRKGDFPATPVILRSTVQNTDAMMSTDNIISEINGSLSNVEVYMQYPQKEQLAYYHHVSGAGKSRRIRKFFDLSDDEVSQLVEMANEKMTGDVKVKTAEQLLTLLKKLKIKTVT